MSHSDSVNDYLIHLAQPLTPSPPTGSSVSYYRCPEQMYPAPEAMFLLASRKTVSDTFDVLHSLREGP